ncbi:MAG TPA: iron-sulfur cluster insertion protein ErpA [Alphaproteobacteria bacterium]|jgi:iron-sulfur cluster insertion protein|nr:iron-sulfur cluster insertion protein ErpA [Alphaproteobacteria bacterium]MDP6272153.1 iron-sulfur cluster insertion protein ErpA [Alphaproteobacteria bacterium]MDP7428653.1 iron-sulfur cluster insertion protein ErpA [Alphaproteobacteria bacterium]HJM51572.1 iron-sulfur cluster insertion protein ErpA [Alphaproteobacteria bacterium]|tara:strand:+ start:270 stop:620 length:351 start_codon:yes stop_codon:yes gene_type:complete
MAEAGSEQALPTLTENAAARIKFLMEQEDEADAMVRLAVDGGGCAGFQYGFSFDHTVAEDDVVVERDGARLVVDSMSLEFLQGAEVDFIEDLIGSAFAVKIPSATSTCSCGTSFAV